MKSILALGLMIAMLFVSGCDDEPQISRWAQFEGIWSPGSITLDGNIQDNWSSSTFEFSVLDENTLVVTTTGIPESRALIWAAQDTMRLSSIEGPLPNHLMPPQTSVSRLLITNVL